VLAEDLPRDPDLGLAQHLATEIADVTHRYARIRDIRIPEAERWRQAARASLATLHAHAADLLERANFPASAALEREVALDLAQPRP
jgi:hypothetical protein